MEATASPTLQMIKAYKTAVLSKDVDALMALYATDVCVFDLWAKWSFKGIQAWRVPVAEWFGALVTERVVVEIELVQEFATPDLVVAVANITYKAISDLSEEIRAMQNRLTWVMKPGEMGWKIVHEHTSAPVDPASMKVMLTLDSADA